MSDGREGSVGVPEGAPQIHDGGSRGVVVVVGPTATGKTELALAVARRFDGEVIGADAYQVYRFMDVGTAKPTSEERGEVPYHLVDVVAPDEPFDAHRFVELADEALEAVWRRGKIAVVAGGTGLYVRSLIRGLADMPGRDEALRAALEAEALAGGSEGLHDRLAAVDPAYAARIGRRDMVRIVRALEVFEGTGRTMTEVHEEHSRRPDRYTSIWLGLDPGRDALIARIKERTTAIFEAGFVREVRRLLDMGFGPELPSMRALGYLPVCRHLAGEIDEAEARRLTARDTVRYARRQRTWFRSEPGVHWSEDARDEPSVMDRVQDFVESAASRSGPMATATG